MTIIAICVLVIFALWFVQHLIEVHKLPPVFAKSIVFSTYMGGLTCAGGTYLFHQSTIGFIIGFFILPILTLIMMIVSFITYATFEPDAALKQYISSFYEDIAYGKWYATRNGSIPPNVYQLNFQYNHIYNCPICLEQFDRIHNGKEDILHCGHRFHKTCLREWELHKLEHNPNDLYKCPCCTTKYNWRQKWNYIYTIQHTQYY
eukprot:85459_1